jgi:hypothetical protein
MRVRLDVAEPLLSHEVETERRLDGMIETAQRGIDASADQTACRDD